MNFRKKNTRTKLGEIFNVKNRGTKIQDKEVVLRINSEQLYLLTRLIKATYHMFRLTIIAYDFDETKLKIIKKNRL